MSRYMRCNQCGYDMYGPEYLSNVVDASSFISNAFYPESALLQLTKKEDHSITCPHCHTTGDWSH